jgi:hypothetical protein
MAEVRDKWEIEKLDGSNWSTWKFQMKHLLMAKEVWGHVDGTLVRPADGANAQAKFDKDVQKTMATLVIGVHSSIVYLVTACETPKDLWDTLKVQYERNTLANKLFLKKQYFTTKMREGQSVTAHLKVMKEITDKLAALGAAVADDEKVVALLISLPPSYETLVTALEAKGDDLTLVFVQQALVNEEQKRQAKQGEAAATESNHQKALRADRVKFKGKCFKCQTEGHKASECREKKPPRPQQQHKRTHNARTAEDDDVGGESQLFVMTTGQVPSETSHTWILDSGASRHMTADKKLLKDYRKFDVPESVRLGDGRTVEAYGSGQVKITVETAPGKQLTTEMSSVLYVPKLACNLFSVRAVTQKGLVVQFGHSCCWIKDSAGRVVGKGKLINRMYQLNCETEVHQVSIADEHQAEKDVTSSRMNLWHQRLGHLNETQLVQAVKKGHIKGVDISTTDNLEFCEGCVEGKMSRKPFKPVGEIKTTRKLQLVHSDVCGPMSVQSFGGSRYFVTFVDDYTRCVKVYFMKHKSQVLEKFKEFEAAATNEAGCKIGTLRTDNGGEYMSSEFEKYLKEKGIKHETSVAHSPQQNGVAERMNRTLMESAKAMLYHAKLGKGFWAEAVNSAAYIRNRVVTSASGQTPFGRWYGRAPDVSHFKVFGCMAYAHVPDVERKKLDKKAKKLRFLGYSSTQKGYRLHDMETHRVVVRRDVTFNESDFGHQKETLGIRVQADGNTDDPVVAVDGGGNQEPRRSQRVTRGKGPVRFGFDEYAEPADHSEVTHVALRVAVDEPNTLREALSSKHSAQWRAAADSEYQSLIENDTWELVDLPVNRKAVGCKWVFKVKHNAQGDVERFKGRLVAKGYSQRYGIDYDETYSPVVRLSSVRTVLAYAVQKDMLVHQMDVVTAFLNGELDEEIYMEQPEGYVEPGQDDMVCKLKKSLYGLKQSPRCWNQTFVKSVESLGFEQSQADPCIFVKCHPGGELSIIAVYVDDLIIMTTTTEEMQGIKTSLSKNFKMKDLGSLHFCLGISVEQSEDGIKLSQKQYIEKLLERYGLQDAKPVSTPMDVNVKLVADDGQSKPVDPVGYQSIVGSLLYAAVATRPDISQAVGVLSRFNSAPTEAHLTAAKRVLRYLKGTINLSLQYKKTENSDVTGYSDAGWADDVDSRRSTTGNVFIMSGSPISWLSQRQSTVALSTAEAEYIALSSACQEAVWLQRLLTDIGENIKPITIMEDNQGAIAIAKNPVGHKRTKHIDIRYHFVREQTQKGVIEIQYLSTKEMLADMFTKPLPRGQFEYLRSKIGMN